MQKHVKKEINMQTALQKLTMTLKIKHIHMKNQHNILQLIIPKPQHHKIKKYPKTTCLKKEKAMKKKKTIIITIAVIILCIITLILGIKVVQKKKEVQTKQELIQSQQELINYIKNDGMNVENKDIYTVRIEKVTTQEELDPIKQEYEKETEVLREAIEEEKAELIEKIVERGYIGEEEVSKYTTERQKEVEVKEEVKENLPKFSNIDNEKYYDMIDDATSKEEVMEVIKKQKEEYVNDINQKLESKTESSGGVREIGSVTSGGGSSSTSESSSSNSDYEHLQAHDVPEFEYKSTDGGFNFR